MRHHKNTEQTYLVPLSSNVLFRVGPVSTVEMKMVEKLFADSILFHTMCVMLCGYLSGPVASQHDGSRFAIWSLSHIVLPHASEGLLRVL